MTIDDKLKREKTKKDIDDLAIFGGQPAFDEPLLVGRPNLGSRDRLTDRLLDILDRRWFTNNGPYVRDLERRVCELTGVKHCIATCNGTTAIGIAARAAGLKGEVIVPSLTYVATAHALKWQNMTPVFCDVDPATHNINPNQIEALITPQTTGIIGVHLWGRACDVDGLTALAAEKNLKLLFDAAHAFACSAGGRMIGGFGDAEVFSFHATKFLSTFEGGAVVTNNDEIAKDARLMTDLGFGGDDEVVSLGINGRMSEVCAAMGLTGLESIDVFIEANHRNYRSYRRELQNIPGLTLLTFDESEKSNYQYIVLEVDEESAGINRDALISVLRAENVLSRRYFYPGCHRVPPYEAAFLASGRSLPETDLIVERVLVVPTGPDITDDIITTISSVIRFVLSKAKRISENLDGSPGFARVKKGTER
jgi:dTDP-4-amino-4,6-dideoxygalactose transaminase